MNLQNAIDAMNEAGRKQRGNYHVTLGDLIDVLEAANSDSVVEFSDGTTPTKPHSYRGYYSDLGLQPTDEVTTAGELLDTLRDAHGSDFTAYKGGKFTMSDDTPLWKAEWGSTGRPIMDVENKGEKLVLVLGEFEF